MAVQEHASLDVHAASGNRVFPHGYRVLPQGLPEPQAVHLADRGLPIAAGVLAGCHRAHSPVGLEILLVLRDVARLCRNLGMGGMDQGLAARWLHPRHRVFLPHSGGTAHSRRVLVLPLQNGQAVRHLGAPVTRITGQALWRLYRGRAGVYYAGAWLMENLDRSRSADGLWVNQRLTGVAPLSPFCCWPL